MINKKVKAGLLYLRAEFGPKDTTYVKNGDRYLLQKILLMIYIIRSYKYSILTNLFTILNCFHKVNDSILCIRYMKY